MISSSTLLNRIKTILENDPRARDSDERVVWHYFNKYHPRNISEITLEEALSDMHNKKFPKFESVVRLRRKIQKEHAYLRGEGYERRKKMGEQTRKRISKGQGFL